MGQFVHCVTRSSAGGGRRRRSSGYCPGRGETAPQGHDVVGRLRGRAREPGLPDRRARGSIAALGTTGAFLLWTISICLGALQNNIHAELACMFPNKSGGVALYAHEAWRKYLTLIGPLATFGYWIGWSVVLSVNGLVAGTLLQSEFFSSSTWSHAGAGFDLTLPIVLGAGLIVIVW